MSLKERFQNLWHVPEDEYEDEDAYEYEEEAAKEEEPAPRRSAFFGGSARYGESTAREAVESPSRNVVNISGKTKVKMAIFKPTTFGEETKTIADELIQKRTVIVNLENTEREISRRIIDFLSGVAYAYGGSIKRIASGTFIIIPYNVDLMGDSITEDVENGSYF